MARSVVWREGKYRVVGDDRQTNFWAVEILDGIDALGNDRWRSVTYGDDSDDANEAFQAVTKGFIQTARTLDNVLKSLDKKNTPETPKAP